MSGKPDLTRTQELYEPYMGSIQKGKCSPEVRSAYMSWQCQRRRCTCIGDNRFKTYGARGIKVEYTAREFITWWLKSIKSFSGENPTIDRIDSSRNYSFDNIRILSRSENSKERIKRLGPARPKKKVLCFKVVETLEQVGEYDSVTAAAVASGISLNGVSAMCRGQLKQDHRTGYTFRFKELG